MCSQSTVSDNFKSNGDQKNMSIYNRLRFSGSVISTEIKEQFLDEIQTETMSTPEKIQVMNSSGEEEEEEDEEKACIQKNEELQNLISSLSEIPESYCAEDGKDVKSEGSLIFDESQSNLESICGLNEVKNTLLNIFIYPAIFPHLFPRRIRWNQLLLYGPPGTGKSMLARAIAGEINAHLHRVSSADLLSHWQGETEKKIRSLFAEVRSNPEPTVLFFDEIDGLCRRRTNTEDDSVRRIKTELLTQLDDFMEESGSHQTYVIAATNCPWEIDSGFMRRFHKRIFVPLPDKEARLEMMRKNFDDIETELSDSEWEEIGAITEGYSGSDLMNVVMASCCERFMQIKNTEYWEMKDDLWVPSTPLSLFSRKINFEDIPPDKVGTRNIILADLKAGIANTPKTVAPEELFKYLEFSRKSNEVRINI